MSDDYYERLVDEGALAAYLSDRLDEADRYEVERHREGHSNETLFVTWGDRELVVRRPPPGATADTAHDVLREYRVTDALVDTGVPVPEPVLACEDHQVIGSDFYVMERVDGAVLRDAEPEGFGQPDRRRRLGEQLVDVLAAVHEVDYDAVGLSDFGRPSGYIDRQVDRWGQQLLWAFDRTAEEREVPALYDVGAWLQENVPSDSPDTLVHGDYTLDNVMFALSDTGGANAADAGGPDLVGVFDWELSTLGDPRTDLGWLLVHWRDSTDPEPVVPELTTTFMERDGYPTRRALVDRWESQTGLPFEHERFYRTLAVYKLAALGEMFYRRYLEGNADDPLYPLMADRVPALATRAERVIDGEEPL